MLTPRPYLSFSQLVLFERSPQEWMDYYFYGEKPRITQPMRFGSELADGLEAGEATGNPLLDLMASKLPKYKLMDKPLLATLKDQKKVIRLLAKPDSAKPDYSAFYEYKTSVRKWTQKMANESDQITFYAAVMWLKTWKIPKDIELICVTTAYQDDGSLAPTGELVRLPTKRTLTDIIKMCARARRAWHEIIKKCEKELL